MAKQDPRTVAIMDSLMESPYPMSIAQLADATSIPYPTLSRRVAVMVAEGSLSIDKFAGPGGRTAFYKLSGRAPSIKWMKGGIEQPEEMTLTQAVDMIKQYPAVGAIDKAIESVLLDFTDSMQTDTVSAETLAELKKRLGSLAVMLSDRIAVITSIQASPMWNMHAVDAIRKNLTI